MSQNGGMVLFVPMARFAAEVLARFPGEAAYVETRAGRTVASAAAGGADGTLVQAESDQPQDVVVRSLEAAGLTVEHGRWVGDVEAAELDRHRPVYVAALGYRSGEGRPGVWVEAFHHEPTAGEVIDRFYDEMRGEGHAGNVSQEEFERLALPNVVVLSPDTLQEYAQRAESR
jgi:hypothetical protein